MKSIPAWLMRTEVIEYYRLTKPLNRAGYYETAHHSQIIKNVRGAILEGRIVALCGVIGSGKTVMLRRLQQHVQVLSFLSPRMNNELRQFSIDTVFTVT